MSDHIYSRANLLRASAISGNEAVLQHYIKEFEEALNTKDHNGCSLLIYAVLADAPKCVALLLEAGVKINDVDRNGRGALHWAAYKNSYQCLNYLLHKGANWKLKDTDGATALHMASRHCNSKCLSLLLKIVQLKDVDAQDNDMRTALHWSACCGHLENIKLLIKFKANSANPDVEGKTPIHWAATSQSPYAAECVKVLLEKSPSAINWLDYGGRGALHLAVTDGTEPVICEIISWKLCNINLLDNSNHTPLHLAAYLGRDNVVKHLLNKNANIISTETHLATPLHFASLSASIKTVEAFVEKLTFVDQRDSNGCSAFMWAAGKPANDIIMQCLLHHGADIQSTDTNGSTALHIASLGNHVDNIYFLLNNGALINAADVYGRSALSYACEMGNAKAVLALLKNGSSLMDVDLDGKTALHWAAGGGHRIVCELLVNEFLCQDIADKHGRTALFYATFAGYVDCFKILIGLNSNLQQCDNEGFSPLHYSANQGHYNAIKYLFHAGANPNCISKNRFRCTALDLALINSHHEVALYLMNNGGVSAVDIFNNSATKIQAAYRGYYIRKRVTLGPAKTRFTTMLGTLDAAKDGKLSKNSFCTIDKMSSLETLEDSVFSESDSKSSESSDETQFALHHELRPLYVKQTQKPIRTIRWNRKKFHETYPLGDKIGSAKSLVNFSWQSMAVHHKDNKDSRVRHHSAAMVLDRKNSPSKLYNSSEGLAAKNLPKKQTLSKALDTKSISMGHLEAIHSSFPEELDLLSVGSNSWITNSVLTRIAKESWTSSLFGSQFQRTRITKAVFFQENKSDCV